MFKIVASNDADCYAWLPSNHQPT